MNAMNTGVAHGATTSGGSLNRLSVLWAVGTGLAVALAALTFVVANKVAGSLVVTGTGEVTLGNVIGFTFFGGIVGAVLAHLIRRFARRPRITFFAVALIALAGYAVVPFTAAENLATAIWLNVLHVVVAIPVVGVLARYVPRQPGRIGA